MNELPPESRERYAKLDRILRAAGDRVAARLRAAARDGVVDPIVLIVDAGDGPGRVLARAVAGPAALGRAVSESIRLGRRPLLNLTLPREAAARLLAPLFPSVAADISAPPTPCWGAVAVAEGVALAHLVSPLSGSGRHDVPQERPAGREVTARPPSHRGRGRDLDRRIAGPRRKRRPRPA